MNLPINHIKVRAFETHILSKFETYKNTLLSTCCTHRLFRFHSCWPIRYAKVAGTLLCHYNCLLSGLWFPSGHMDMTWCGCPARCFQCSPMWCRTPTKPPPHCSEVNNRFSSLTPQIYHSLASYNRIRERGLSIWEQGAVHLDSSSYILLFPLIFIFPSAQPHLEASITMKSRKRKKLGSWVHIDWGSVWSDSHSSDPDLLSDKVICHEGSFQANSSCFHTKWGMEAFSQLPASSEGVLC